MIKDYSLKEIINSPLKTKLIKHSNNNNSFISLFGSFYLTTDTFLPICSDTFCTSTDLFGFYKKIKYSHFFTLEFQNKISSLSEEIETVENAFVLGSTGNYFHDLVECYSRIFSFNSDLIFHKKIDKIVISEVNTKHILVELLSLLKIKLPINVLKKNTIYKFTNSTITANRNYPRTISLYRNMFLKNKNQNKNQKNVFISRKDATNRLIENEDQIINFLSKHNFSILTLYGKSLKQQVDLFSSSQMIISMHGAALTNLLFVPSGATIIEITGNFLMSDQDWISEKNSTEHNQSTRSMYNYIAAECNINHYYYFTKISTLNNKNVINEHEKFTFSNLIIDESKFIDFIQKILK